MGLRQSIRTRVLAIVLGAFTVVVALAGAVLTTVVARVLQDQARNSAVATAGWVADELHDRPIDRVVAEHAGTASHERLIQILAPDGSLLAGSPAGVPALAVPAGRSGHTTTHTQAGVPGFDSDSFIVAVTGAKDQSGRVDTVVIGLPANLEERAKTTIFSVGVVAGLLLLVAVGLGVRYAVSAALRPVDAMRREVRAITDIGSSGHLAVPGGEDELSRLATTLNDLLDRLRSADAARRAFVADAGHELRSPLTTAGLSLERLSDPTLAPADRTRAAERARVAVDRLGGVVEDLLVLGSLDQQRLPETTLTALDLDDLVLRAVRAMPSGSPPVALDLAPVQLRGDERLLDRLVRNLLDNASRHSREAIRVRVAQEGGSGLLTVENDGPPVPEADRKRVFERFVRLDEARDRDRGGSGLGLSVVAQAAARHGGTVTTDAAPDGWCRFTVTLPLPSQDTVTGTSR